LVHSTITADGDEAIVRTTDDGKLSTHETGTTTGETQVDGTVTTDGTVTNDEVGTETTAVDGTEAITEVGTEFGTLVHSTITADGDDAIVITTDDGKLSTHEIGTTTGETQVDGTVTTDGTKTNDEVATVTTAVDGTEAMTEVGTEFGTLVHSTITTDGDEATTTT